MAIQAVRDSTKAEAIAWATAREAEIRTGRATGIQAGRTIGYAFNRYEKEVSATNETNASNSSVSLQLVGGRYTESRSAL